jgi:hypothetical protein
VTARIAVVLLALLLLSPHARADAAPISLSDYRGALASVRIEVDSARRASGADRRRATAAALSTLAGITEVQAGGATFTALPHEPIAQLLRDGDDSSLELASGMLAETIAALPSDAGATVDAERARSLLTATLASSDFRRQPSWNEALAELLRDGLAALFPDLRAPTLTSLQVAVALSGVVTLLVAIIAYNAARGLRAKIAREAVLASASTMDRPGAADRLREAEEAIRRGRLRDGLRALFLAALAGLEERGGVRLDPALTDREILARAAGSPRADELSSLVALYEPAWYGVREPTEAEVARAGELARRIGM